jgi:hypothetical protein
MSNEPLYLSWDNETSKQEAYKSTASNVDAYTGLQKAEAYGRTSYIGIEPNRSVRPEFSRLDYDLFRPTEATPLQQKRIIKQCMMAYDKVGIVRNVIDLMSDFGSQGMQLYHPNPAVEKFFRKWFHQIGGYDRTERFLNYLYRCGNVIVRRRNAKLSRENEKEIVRAAKNEMVDIEIPSANRREIPWQYDFLNPLAIDVIENGTGALGQPQFVLNLSKYTQSSILQVQKNNTAIYNSLPSDIKKRLNTGDNKIPLDPESTMFYFYKKDDWQFWANPMIYAILDDIKMLEKMKLADLAALDGAISNVRLWTIGDLEHKIIPTKTAINKLRDILASNVGGGTMDMVWGPELRFTESQSQVYKFLGKEKYDPVLTSIYAGLGIPPTLTGVSAGGGGYSNNYISLKTLIERLEYGREIVKKFWKQELEIIRKAMGFRLPAEIHFDAVILSDETTERKLLIDLADRDIISNETLLERFGELPTIEKVRVSREERQRRSDIVPDKASPYHKPQFRNDIARIALQKDKVADEFITEMGIPVKEAPPAKNTTTPSGQTPISQKPIQEAGRPDGATDTEPRKRRRVNPQTSEASIVLWGIEAQDKISDIVNPIILDHFNKADVRSLTKEQSKYLDSLKLGIFANLNVMQEVDEETVKSIIDSDISFTFDFADVLHSNLNAFASLNNRHPNINETKMIRSCSFAQSSKNP